MRGLLVVDPQAGVLVQAIGAELRASPWTLRTAAAIEDAAADAMRKSVGEALAAARNHLAATVQQTGRLPAERSPTIIDSAVARHHEGLLPEYFVEADGTMRAKLTYANEPSVSFRWTPSAERDATGMPRSFECATNQAAATRYSAPCEFAPDPEALSPRLVYVLSRMPEMKASASQDARYQSANRGATFGVRYSNRGNAEAWVGCVGLPASRVVECDIDRGDNPCSTSLPLLCVSDDPKAAPRYTDAQLRDRWVAARIAASQPVRGDSVPSIAAADAMCAAEFGAGWRVTRYGIKGDGCIASGQVSEERRLWIHVEQRPEANCWSE
jgi:hypothetical protein